MGPFQMTECSKADSKMVYEDVEEEGHGNLVLEMIKEVGKDENVTYSV